MKYRNTFLTIISVLLVSCTVEPAVEKAGGEGTGAGLQKICNTSSYAEQGVLLAKFSEAAVPSIEAAVQRNIATRSAVTRSGIASVDEIFSEIGVTSFERVFPETEQYEKNTRAAGLHRWYYLTFAPDQDLEKAAARLASVAEVSKVQFNKERTKAFSGETYPLVSGNVPASQTKAIVRADFNDPELMWQWHYINNADQAISTTAHAGADINVAEAWKLTGGDPRVIVAVVDEGVKYTHPDLAANMWTNPEPSEAYDYQDIHGWNFAAGKPVSWAEFTTDASGKVSGDSGHGTHVAGTVAAVNNNGIGVAGVAGGTGKGDGVRIMSCQIFSGDVNATDRAVGQAIKYAADHGASILQCSYGYAGTPPFTSDREYEEFSPVEMEALRYFMDPEYNTSTVIDGGIAIYSAGNDSQPYSNYPGGYRECISVTSIGPDGLPAYYTCYGDGCNIAAPGGETTGHAGKEKAGVLSTLVSEISGTDYGYNQGTSMACPHVSGVAALGLSYMLQKDKKISREDFISMLLTSVNEIDSRFEGTKTTGATLNLEDYRGKMGSGLVDAYQLLMQIEGTPCLKVPTGNLELITLTQYFGGSAEDLIYTGLEISDADIEKLGMPAKPKMYNGQLMIKCTRPGVAHIKVSAVAGGKRPGSESVMGGIEVTKEFAVIARESAASNGGWL